MCTPKTTAKTTPTKDTQEAHVSKSSDSKDPTSKLDSRSNSKGEQEVVDLV